MTREEIVRLAREAGLIDPDLGECVTDFGDATDSIHRFAALVAAAEREQILVAAYQVAMYQVAAEREACAVLAETPMYRHEIAEKIRARGEI